MPLKIRCLQFRESVQPAGGDGAFGPGVPFRQPRESGDRDHAELNRIIAKENYSATDKERLLALDERYGFSAAQAPRGALVFLQKIRGQLFSRAGGSRSVVASGRASGWVGSSSPEPR